MTPAQRDARFFAILFVIALIAYAVCQVLLFYRMEQCT